MGGGSAPALLPPNRTSPGNARSRHAQARAHTAHLKASARAPRPRSLPWPGQHGMPHRTCGACGLRGDARSGAVRRTDAPEGLCSRRGGDAEETGEEQGPASGRPGRRAEGGGVNKASIGQKCSSSSSSSSSSGRSEVRLRACAWSEARGFSLVVFGCCVLCVLRVLRVLRVLPAAACSACVACVACGFSSVRSEVRLRARA